MTPDYIPRNLYLEDTVISEVDLLAQHRVVVVLAEPGAGKTELLQSLAERLGVQSCRASLFRHRQVQTPVAAVVVDAVDEVARVDIAAFDLIIEKARQTQATTVVFSSRSSEWDRARTKLVQDCFGQSPAIVRLKPFSSEEQRLLFQTYRPGEEFSQFESEAARFELGPLLGNPQFLRLFADAYVQGGRRFTSKSQIFVDAIERLASELNTSPWQRDRPSTKAIVSAASDIFSKLLLSGGSGIAIADEGDIDFPYLHSLSEPTPALSFVPNTRLFKPATEPDRHEPVHRIVAEYCAARHLATRAGDPAAQLSVRRLLSIIAPNSVVRDELRGLLGWTAALGNLAIQETCIRTDPYAVLSNGDPSQLAASSKRLLLTELKKLSEFDPYFRRSDGWRRFSAAGFFDRAMVSEVQEVLTDRNVNPELRNLILELLQDSEVASSVTEQLEALVLDSDVDVYTRLRAQQVLSGLNKATRPATINALLAKGDSGSLRIVLEIAVKLGSDAIGVDAVRDLLEHVGKRENRGRVPRSRDRDDNLNLPYLTKQVVASLDSRSVVSLLNELTRNLRCTCGKSQPYECECRPGPSKTIGWLLDRYFEIEAGPHDPARIWAWTRHLIFSGNRRPPESTAIQALMKDDELRQSIHRLAFSECADLDQVWETRIGLTSGFSHAGLGIKLMDFLALSEHAVSTGNAVLWQGFYLAHNFFAQQKGPDAHRAILKRQARSGPPLLAVWSKLERGNRENLRKERRLRLRRRSRWQRRQEAQKNARRQFYRDNKAQIEAGLYFNALCELAEYYLLKPDDREEVPDDPQMAERALTNCFPLLDAYVPTLSARAGNDRPDIVRVLHAACMVIYRRQGNLDGMDRKILRAVKTDIGGYSGVSNEEAAAFEAEIDRQTLQSLADAEAFAREFIEPSLTAQTDLGTNVGWLRYKTAFKPLQRTLALEWLERYPNMPRPARDSLFDMCAEQADRDELIKLILARCDEIAGGRPEDREFWLLRALFFLSDPPLAVWEYLKGSGDTIFAIEHRAGRLNSGESAAWPTLSAEKVYRILDIYVEVWPKVFLPSSWGTGSPRPETAYRFLRDVIFSINRDEPGRAVAVLDRILSNARLADFHTDARSLKAAALRKLAFRDFSPPSPEVVVNMLDKNRIATVEDLRAFLLEELEAYQIWLQNAETNPLDVFYQNGVRLNENDSRNRIVEHLHSRLASRNLSVIIEHHMANANRCDITAAAMIEGQRRLLVIEVKGQWHTELFSAASAQLHERYSVHPDAAMQGIYLVLWFGAGETIAGRREAAISTPDMLRQAIRESMPVELRDFVDVVVLDLSRSQ
ncbi:hypothetical protein [Bradyrhizobium sp. CCGUVB23]|uniref:hypothetical protein n=1 Tax=Bradyrhizobium sp. CCGUVB23 TaxID=2949630 RepID=UPI0020B1E732|nr:hypothetical protein [Bradyrhizobium sp. CCGUVB23]MCP3463515.1 hypothetical protein [Bradyrhizobium sp. CCGUVB23]